MSAWKYRDPSCGFIVVDQRGYPVRMSFSSTRGGAIQGWLNGIGERGTWHHWRKQGFRVKRARVEIVESERG